MKMNFVKRVLTDEELRAIDFHALGIEKNRIPPATWNWAVDRVAGVLFSQLVSNSNEMREGIYWYLLLLQNVPLLIMVDAWSGLEIGGRFCLRAEFKKSSELGEFAAHEIEKLASEAMSVISSGKGLVFKAPLS